MLKMLQRRRVDVSVSIEDVRQKMEIDRRNVVVVEKIVEECGVTERRRF